MCWNINGWTERNRKLRYDIITGLNSDVVCLVETHLLNHMTLDIEGYKTILHNRMEHHVRTRRGFGGVAFLIKTTIFEDYEVIVLDKEYDGICVLKLTNKYTNYTILIFGLYLPPENSPWGRDGLSFFAHVLSCIYQYTDVDAIYVEMLMPASAPNKTL